MSRHLLRSTFLALLAFLLVNCPVRGSEQQLTELIRRAKRIVIGTSSKTVDLRDAGAVSVRIDRGLRGRGRKGEQFSLMHDGGEASPRLEADARYLFFLRKAADDAGWLFVGKTALPFRDGAVQTAAADDPTKNQPIALEIVQGLIDKYPPEAALLLPKRSSFGGRWSVLLATSAGDDVPLWIIDVVKQKDSYETEVLSLLSQFSAARVESTVIDEGSIRLSILAEDTGDQSQHAFEFEGRMQDGIVLGNIMIDGDAIMPAQLQATSDTKISQTEPAKASRGKDVLIKAGQAEDTFAAYQQFVKDFADSPLVPAVYTMMLNSETTDRMTPEQLRELTSRFFTAAEKWGDRLRDQATVDAAVIIATRKKHPGLALEFLKEAETRLGKDGPKSSKKKLAFHTAISLNESNKPQQAITLLTQLHQEDPFDLRVSYRLAGLLESQGKTDEAIAVYAELSALPGVVEVLEQQVGNEKNYVAPMKQLIRLWRQKHGHTGEMSKYVMDVYRRTVHGFTKEKFAPRGDAPGAGNRVALVELFTGAQCPPCVAADLGTGGLEDVFEHSEVIVIRYHVHNPGPDPLTGPDNEDRRNFYNIPGTPVVVINGTSSPAGSLGGYIIHTQKIYNKLRSKVAPILKETDDIKIKLSAQADGKNLDITAEATRPAGFSGEMRLRLALVEAEIPFIASNGILLHEMLVRTMPGGAKGIKPVDGKLEFQSQIGLEEFRTSIIQSLGEFEEIYSNTSGEEFKFPKKPIGPKKLSLVAFVQDDAGKKVLQSAIVPVKGEFDGTR